MTFAFSVNDVCIKISFKSKVILMRTAIIKCTLTHIYSLTDENDCC